MSIEFKLGDCLEELAKLPDESIDEVITDPPYNVGKDYGVYKDNLPPEEYKEWMMKVISESRRVSRNGIVFFVSGDLVKDYQEMIPDAHLVIVYKRSAGIVKDNYARQYHAIFSTVKPTKRVRDLWDDVRLPGEGYFFKERRYNNPGMTGFGLTMKMIKSFTSVGDVVLDPFMGCGTTGIACFRMNRDFIGIENNLEYIDIARKRIEEQEKITA